MNNYQDILNSYNQIQNLSITYSSKEKNHVYKHINLIYTDSGIPYIEMYPGDQIEIIKQVFVNTKEVFGTFENEIDFSINDSEQNVGLTYNASTNIISAIKPGSYKIESNKFGMIDVSKYDIANYNDPDILIVIKEVPEIKEILWGFNSNPLLVNVKDNSQEIFIKVNAKYSDGIIKELEPDFIYNNFNITSSNESLGIISIDLTSNIDEPKITNIKLCLGQYKDQLKLSLVTKTENSILKNVKLPNDLQVITYFNENEIEDIKQAVYYIYYLTDNENDINVNKQYYIEKNTPTLFYVKMLNGYYERGEFKIVDDKDVSRFSSLSSESSNIEISMDEYDHSFIITGVNEVDNVVIKLNTSLPQANDVTFNQISVIDSIKKLTWQINNNVITEIDNNVITKHVNNIDINVTDLHNVLLNEVICETLSGKIIHIETDCVFNSTQKDSSDVNENLSIDNNKMIVNKSHECKIIFNASNKYKLPNILETVNFVLVNIIMTKEYVFADKIEIYEKNDVNMNLLNDKEIDMQMLSSKILYAKVYPDNATYKDVKWFSDDTDIATIDNDGNLKIINSGAANIICTIKYPEPENPEFPENVDGNIYDPNTGSVRPLGFNPPDISAIININATKVDVSEISFDRASTTLYVDGDHQPYYVRVKPEGASITDVKVKFESDDSTNDFFDIDSNDEMYVKKSGTGKLIAYSVDNPEITAEMSIVGIDTRVRKVTITTLSNDNEYEYYDHLNEHKIYTTNGDYVVTGERVTNEKYDDDDFNRYYLPVNNSMQLSVNIEPKDAINKNIKWLSSDSSLVKVNDKGIITAIRRGKQELDVYGDDDVSETRFANTVWITAINTKYNKYDVCQVRVTRNKTLAINIPATSEHDYDIDDILPSGDYDRNAEHEFDYVMNVGDSIKVPVTLTTQDNNFGTSDSLVWLYSGDGKNILEISDGSPDHSNAYDDDYDWTTNNPVTVNNNKNSFDLTIKAIGIGDTYFYAKTKDNVRGFGSKQLYVPASAYVVEVTEYPGLTGLDTNYGAMAINIYWKSKKCMAIYDLKQQYKQKLNELLENNISGEGSVTININGVTITIMENGVNKVDEALDSIIDDEYIAKNGIPVIGAKCILMPNGLLKIIIPDKCHIDNLKTKGDNSCPISFDYIPTIDKNASTITDDNGDEILDVNKANEYIFVHVYFAEDKLKRMPIFLDGIYRTEDDIIKRQMYAMEYTSYKDETNSTSKYIIKGLFPTPTKTGDVLLEYGDAFNAKPGMGVWVDGPKSRNVRVRVVATPTKLQIGWINAYNDELLSINTIRANSITRNKWSINKYHYMAIGTDDEFKELVEDAKSWGGTLAEKYKSFAWFSDNEDVIRFEDVEDLSYVDSNGKYTNNPNESIKETKTNTKTISFKNINASNFTGYRYVGPLCDVKFGDNYTYNNQDDLYVNNTSMCILRMKAKSNGRFFIKHTGSIQYANNELFNNSTTLTVQSGYKDSYINANKGDTIYIKGATSTIVYIRQIGFYWSDGGFDGYLTKNILDKVPTEYSEFTNNIYIKLPDDSSRNYVTNNGIKLYDSSTAIKFISKYNGHATVTFSGGSIKIYNKSSGTTTVGSSVSPYTFNIEQGEEYIITGNSTSGSVISKIEYTNILDAGTEGGYKGTSHYTMKSSFMKRVICEGRGSAKIYVLSPKGQALVKKTIYIK